MKEVFFLKVFFLCGSERVIEGAGDINVQEVMKPNVCAFFLFV
jgi:hypothetical protein